MEIRHHNDTNSSQNAAIDSSIECGELHSQTTIGSPNFLVRIILLFGLKPRGNLPFKIVFLHAIGPYHRGFFCNDDSIRLPYKTSTIPFWLLAFYCLSISTITFIIVEYCRLVNQRTSSEFLVTCERGEVLRVRLLIRLVFFKGFFLIAMVATLIFTSLAKFTVGRLRPHFLAICEPLINGKETEADFCSLLNNQHFYVENYTCSNNSYKTLIDEARLSFFSGHSSLSMCAAVFTILYLHCRLKPLVNDVVIIPLVQICVLSSAMFISYSRIFDNMHHWSDVLIGMTTGSSVATFVVFFFFNFIYLFKGLNIVGFKLNPNNLEEFILLKDRGISAEK